MPAASSSTGSTVRLPSYSRFASVTVARCIFDRSISLNMRFPLFKTTIKKSFFLILSFPNYSSGIRFPIEPDPDKGLGDHKKGDLMPQLFDDLRHLVMACGLFRRVDKGLFLRQALSGLIAAHDVVDVQDVGRGFH